MEHRTGLALAGAVVAIGGSGAIAIGTFTGVIGQNPEDVPAVAQPAAAQQPATEPSRSDRRKRPVQRVTRYVDVPMPAPQAAPAGNAAAPAAAPAASAVAPPAAAVAPAPAPAAVAPPAGEAPATHSSASPVAAGDDDAPEDRTEATEDRLDEAADRREALVDERQDAREERLEAREEAADD